MRSGAPPVSCLFASPAGTARRAAAGSEQGACGAGRAGAERAVEGWGKWSAQEEEVK